ncbi:MAG: hypothetical protein ACYCZW_00880 [Minisyncoccota bacterium]
MTTKKTFLIASAVLAFLIIIYGVTLYRDHQKNQLLNPTITVTVTPETATAQATSTQPVAPITLTFTLTPQAALDISSAHLETVASANIPLTQIPLSKSANGTFAGTFTTPSTWLSPAQTVSFAVYVNDIKTSYLVRLALTDLPLTLPSDPGEAGKATLAGIDSNDDGIRDDLEREIVFMHPESDQLRRVLRAMVKREQDLITTEGDHEHFKQLAIEYFGFQHCYEYLTYRSIGKIAEYDNTDFLFNLSRNTPQRLEKDRENSDKATPYASTIYSDYMACTQPLVNGQY